MGFFKNYFYLFLISFYLFFTYTTFNFYLFQRNIKLLCIYFAAPGSYDVEKVEKTVHQSSPAYSFGVKYKEREQEHLPGNA